MNDTAFSSLADLARGLKKGAYSSRELTQMFLDRIARYDEKAHAYVAVYGESALLQAHAADLQRQAGLPLPPLHGLPIAVKDLCEIEGKVTAAGSFAWKTRRSTVTSAVVERLQAAGMILLGKTHTVEFAFGGWGTNPHMGTPRNPWDWSEHHRIPGGSSSGSAVAVAAGLAPVAIGTDTGGSVRVPSALNGLTGLKTTRGLISLYGTVPLSATLDSIGPLARTAEDAAMVTQALAGFDPRDASTRECRFDAIAPTRSISLRHLRIAVMQPKQYPWPVADDVHRATEEAARVFQSLGARIESVEIPVDFAELMRNNGTITAAEGYRLHLDYIEDPELPFGPAVKKRIINGKSVNASAYLAALAHRREAIVRFNDWMQSYDCLLTPTVPFVACPLHEVDENSTSIVAFGRPVNYLNACALTVPAGFSEECLPIGVQLIAKPFQENLLLQAGNSFQNVTDWHRRRPPELP
jgi:aspartyl-tRNA(Asn)/glutamyl-tRNA(Gln) amidotransferase subunit A